MAKWANLPIEVRNLILFYFCNDIVFDFSNPEIDVWDPIKNHKLWNFRLIIWPTPPKCLKSFISALLTCRHFHDTIIEVIKFDGEPVDEVLQRIQYDHIGSILDQLDDDYHEPVNISFFFTVAGCFWRNAKVCGGPELLIRVLWWTGVKSRMMLLPHLEHWVRKHAYSSSTAGTAMPLQVVLEDVDPPEWTTISLKQGGLAIVGGEVDMHSIAGVVGRIPKKKASLCVLSDIKASHPDTWWLFPSEDKNSIEAQGVWCLVNYELKKIYAGPDGTTGWYWGEDIWDVENWKTDEE